ncbi:MAG: small multi-drug export protein [Desulfatitalea sp.]|nr:small multi-drug export protein [Desulfatitalea sp.]
MKYGLKIFNLFRKATTKIAWLIRDRFDLPEVKILALGLGMTLLAGLYLLYLLFVDRRMYGVLSSTIALHIMGGRGAGVVTCLTADIPVIPTILFNFYIEIVCVLLAYGVIVLVLRNMIQHKFFHQAVRQAEQAAQSHKTRIKKYGGIGLWLFVIFPFFMTGPVIGSIIGYLLNYKPINNFLIVFSATLTSIIIYTLAGNQIIVAIEQYVNLDAVKAWGGIIVAILIVCFLIYHMKTIKAFLDSDDPA